MKLKYNFLSVILLLCVSASHAQTPLEDGDLSSQFTYIITKSETYEDYQVIKRVSLNKLKANTLDTIKVLKSKQNELSNQVSTLQSEIKGLTTSLNETEDQLATITKEKNSMRLLGILMPKGTYYAVIGFIIVGLIAALGILFFLFKRSHSVTQKTKETLANTMEEYDKHRKWALENEKKLSRELLKEKNRGKGLI